MHTHQTTFPPSVCRFVMTVSIERLLAIMMPLRARYFWRNHTVLAIYIAFLFLLAFVINFNYHIHREYVDNGVVNKRWFLKYF
jgi:hypothetical protein